MNNLKQGRTPHLAHKARCGPRTPCPQADTGASVWRQPGTPDGDAHAVTGPRSCPPSTNERRAGDVGGFVRGEVEQSVGDLGGPDHPRMPAPEPGSAVEVGKLVRSSWASPPNWVQELTPDAERAELLRGAAR